jgi:predicted nucleic acid-binding protein
MRLTEVSNGETVLVDANIFIYAFAPDPTLGPPCQEFLERIDNGDLRGVVSSHILSNVSHRLMSLEACQTFGWPYTGIASRLARHPTEVQQLHRYRQAIDDIIASGIQIVPVESRHIVAGNSVSVQVGLLSNDALTVAIMREMNLVHLASHDADFDLVSGIVRCSPA